MEKRPPLPFEILRRELLKKDIFFISYDELLWTTEWIEFRELVKQRDNYTCTNCGKSKFLEMNDEEYEKRKIEEGYGKYCDLINGIYTDFPTQYAKKKNNTLPSRQKVNRDTKLEVHHKYYIWNNFPWEYEKEALTTLCDSCHEQAHSQEIFTYTDKTLKTRKKLIPCARCGARGYIEEFKHIQGGICFNCWGMGGLEEGEDFHLFNISDLRFHNR